MPLLKVTTRDTLESPCCADKGGAWCRDTTGLDHCVDGPTDTPEAEWHSTGAIVPEELIPEPRRSIRREQAMARDTSEDRSRALRDSSLRAAQMNAAKEIKQEVYEGDDLFGDLGL